MLDQNPNRKPKWYFGGMAGTMAVCVTHPLDLIKVQLQCNPGQNLRLTTLPMLIMKTDGVMGFYQGLSAAIARQLTYSTSRFAIYDMCKAFLGQETSFGVRIGLAAVAGATGAFPGVPPGKVNVRMQNDLRLPKDKQKHYKHIFDGLIRVYKEEGFKYLFSGASMASTRAGVMAVGQLFGYDQFKRYLLSHEYFEDNLTTHVLASFSAALLSTTITQPFDVLKTRIMNSTPGQFKNLQEVVAFTAKDGPFPLGFFKGYIPAFLRLGSHTVLMFVFYEQLRLTFGDLPSKDK